MPLEMHFSWTVKLLTKRYICTDFSQDQIKAIKIDSCYVYTFYLATLPL